MKLSIELEDNDLQKLVHQQLGASIASITDEAIKTIAVGIINKKLERLTQSVVDDIVKLVAKGIIEAQLGQSEYQRRNVIIEKVDGIAKAIVKEALK